MGSMIRLTASDGQIFQHLCAPEGTSKGGIVVIQEIFGVNSHIKEVTDRIATAGYLAIAPAYSIVLSRRLLNMMMKVFQKGTI